MDLDHGSHRVSVPHPHPGGPGLCRVCSGPSPTLLWLVSPSQRKGAGRGAVNELFPKGNEQGEGLFMVVLAKLLGSLIPVTPPHQTVPNTFRGDSMASSELPVVAHTQTLF